MIQMKKKMIKNDEIEHNLKKAISACVLGKKQTHSLEEAKQICADKFKK